MSDNLSKFLGSFRYTEASLDTEEAPVPQDLTSYLKQFSYADAKAPLPEKREPVKDKAPVKHTADSLMPLVVQTESGGKHVDENGNLVRSKAGAEGITQLMPSTAKKPGYGIEPVKDKSESEYLRVGKEYLAALLKKFDGDAEKALAAYNHGIGNVSKALGKAERYGGNWKEMLPEETKNYLNKILGRKNAKER